ncbi:hypothetical protein ACMXYO_06895 [Neptuniibacter sp. QD37_6]|uniref:hypothetical protein n=1 Tax=Neptuniibacter sp. QD37_6 TaxID=3398210 RepID=UPI0039F4F15D
MDLSTLEHHKYIKLIEFALSQKNFSKVQACEAAGLTRQEFDFVRHEIFILSGAQTEYVNDHEEYEWKLSTQAFFNYLQFSEFKFAVSAAKKAQLTAMAAIVISGILAIGSIVVTVLN